MTRISSTEPHVRYAYWALGAFTLLLIVSFVLGDRSAPAGRRLAKVTGIDPPAYFGVSHSLLFDRDFELTNEFQRVVPDDNPWTAIRPETGHPGSAYAIGFSLLSMPFLAVGTLLDAVAGNPADGFSPFAILGFCLTNITLTGLGLIAVFTLLRRTAELWGLAGPRVTWYALFATFAIFFGTTVAYYAFSQMSHASTFFASSIFVTYWWRVRDRTDVRGWLLLGLLGGVLSLCRWQEMFFVGAPFVYDIADRQFFSKLGPWLRARAAYVAMVAVCWIPQILEWKFIYGKFFTNPYGQGTLILPPPFIPQLLFSSINGWFIFTPLALLGVGGLIFGLVKMGRVYLPWLVVIALEIALIGAAPVAYHGSDLFGARYLTSCAPLLGLGLVNLLYGANQLTRVAVIAVTPLFCLFTSLFAVQFRLDLIPRHERLTIAECFTDKLNLVQARRRKVAVQQAEALLQQGSTDAAVKSLEQTANTYGRNRDVLNAMRKAYRAAGNTAEAENTERQWEALQQSRMW